MSADFDLSADRYDAELPEPALRELFRHTGHRCQCRLPHCDHAQHCERELNWEDRGRTWLPVNLFPGEDSIIEPSFKWFIYCVDCADQWHKAQQL